jgi:NAD(P)-dependent dehydrogenase (short-subunit alcohol dehydrogenase family)
MSLEGKRVVLVGGTAGIGLATAKRAAAEGAELVIASSRKDRIEQALAQLPAQTVGEPVDVTDESAVVSFLEAVGELDHLVYTAGDTLALAPFAATDSATARRIFEVRLWGAATVARHAAPRIRPGGSIVLSSGSAGTRPHPGWSFTAACCGASEALARALAVELAPIRVNTVRPGVTRTELWNSFPPEQREGLYQQVGSTMPVGRVAEPDDIAEAYLYLLRAQFSTGAVVTVDGGSALV